MNDDVPNVNREDVLRIIARDFDESAHESIIAALDEYQSQESHGEPHRVHLAILKLSAGDVTRVPVYVRTACSDFRDVLSAAEYPLFSQAGFAGVSKMTFEQVRNLQASDRQQYDTWLND